MKILTKYVMKEILGPMLFGFFAFTSIFGGVIFLGLLRDAERYHLTVFYIIKLLALRMPEYMMQAAPIAVLLGALLGLGNLTSHSETIAMRAGGLTYGKLAYPVILIGLAVSIGGVLLNEYVVPNALRTYDQLKNNASKEVTKTIRHFYKDFYDGDSLKKLIYADRYEPKTKELFGVAIQEFHQGSLTRTIEASKLYWKDQNWFFNNGRIYEYLPDNFYPIVVKEGRVKYDLSLTPSEIEQLKEDPENKSISELSRYIKRFAPQQGSEKRGLLVDLHMKFSIPLASLILALLGTPLALRPQRRSNAAGFGLCIIFILVWYIFMGIGTFMARSGAIPPFLGAWLPNLVLAGYGLVITRTVKS
ncbi:lipopolysaccharide export system permease protein [Hydrogenispora ethanolica]|uniref:Lipopolysaccharide export system permease protein n=1 Tax=Hydrogenispora ethanolica TaxID=1082276 RepID=A0A4R1RDN5_HYDET|nr:LptF/LptG family permease [Hydrogenispora ethanolica]TCL63740.1 lipopolysaccharide export system permease protein [Hydrogenispora ethanolica]